MGRVSNPPRTPLDEPHHRIKNGRLGTLAALRGIAQYSTYRAAGSPMLRANPSDLPEYTLAAWWLVYAAAGGAACSGARG